MLDRIQDELQKQIEKASSNNDTEIVAVMKEVKKLLKDDVVKYRPDQPREHGKFVTCAFTKEAASNLSNRERAKVSSDINNVFWARYAGRKYGKIATYNPDDNKAYDYEVEISGFDDYNIYGKAEIID